MDGVAIRAHDIRSRMNRTPDVGARNIFLVAAEASFLRLIRGEGGESGDSRFSAAIRDMSAPGTVASLASGLRRRFFARGDRSIMSVLIEVQPHVRVTGLAGFAANVSVGSLRRRLCLQ